MCLVIRVMVCIFRTCRVRELLRCPKLFNVAKSDFLCVLSCWALGRPVTFATSERFERVGVMLLTFAQAELRLSQRHAISSSNFHVPSCSLPQHVSSCVGSSKCLGHLAVLDVKA